jgi:hypothetical protein
MSANIKASTDGTQAIIGVGGVDQMTVSNAGVVTANSFVGNVTGNIAGNVTGGTISGNASSATALATTFFGPSITARTLTSRFGDVVNVKDYGAKGDGTVDDTAAIQAAIDDNINATIFFPTGIYNITSTLKVDYSITTGRVSLNLLGVGAGSALLWNGGDNTQIIWYEGVTINAGFFSNTVIEGLFLRNPVNASGLIGMKFGNLASPFGFAAGVCNITIQDCIFDDFTIGIATEYECDSLNILRNQFRRYKQYGAYIAGSSGVRAHYNNLSFGKAGSVGLYSEYTTIDFSNNLIQSPDTNVAGAIHLKNAIGFTITNNYIEFPYTGTQFGIFINNTQTGYIANNLIQGMQGADCIYIDQNSANINIGPNSYASVIAPMNSLIRLIPGGGREINILAQQRFTSGPLPTYRLLGIEFNCVTDDGYFMLGQPEYTSLPDAGITMANTGVVNVGNNARPTGWGFLTFNRSGVQIGSVTQSGTTGVSYNILSDIRLKEDNGITQKSRINDVKVHDFTWKSDGYNAIGVFAQELADVIPEAVTKGIDNNQYWQIDYSKLVPDLIVEVQSLRAELDKLKTTTTNN